MPTYTNIYFKIVYANVYTVLMIQAHTHSQLEFRINICGSLNVRSHQKAIPYARKRFLIFCPRSNTYATSSHNYGHVWRNSLDLKNAFAFCSIVSMQFDDYKRLPCCNPTRRKRHNDDACFIITLINNNNRFILQPLYRRAKPNFPPETVTSVESGGVRTRGRL